MARQVVPVTEYPALNIFIIITYLAAQFNKNNNNNKRKTIVGFYRTQTKKGATKRRRIRSKNPIFASFSYSINIIIIIT